MRFSGDPVVVSLSDRFLSWLGATDADDAENKLDRYMTFGQLMELVSDTAGDGVDPRAFVLTQFFRFFTRVDLSHLERNHLTHYVNLETPLPMMPAEPPAGEPVLAVPRRTNEKTCTCNPRRSETASEWLETQTKDMSKGELLKRVQAEAWRLKIRYYLYKQMHTGQKQRAQDPSPEELQAGVDGVFLLFCHLCRRSAIRYILTSEKLGDDRYTIEENSEKGRPEERYSDSTRGKKRQKK